MMNIFVLILGLGLQLIGALAAIFVWDRFLSNRF